MAFSSVNPLISASSKVSVIFQTAKMPKHVQMNPTTTTTTIHQSQNVVDYYTCQCSLLYPIHNIKPNAIVLQQHTLVHPPPDTTMSITTTGHLSYSHLLHHHKYISKLVIRVMNLQNYKITLLKLRNNIEEWFQQMTIKIFIYINGVNPDCFNILCQYLTTLMMPYCKDYMSRLEKIISIVDDYESRLSKWIESQLYFIQERTWD
jgi:hypothetical protein